MRHSAMWSLTTVPLSDPINTITVATRAAAATQQLNILPAAAAAAATADE